MSTSYATSDLSYIIVYNGTDPSYISIIGLASAFTGSTITIPQDISSYPVQEISANAFEENSSIQTLDASNSYLKLIANRSLKDCINLTNVNLSNSLFLTDISFEAFYNSGLKTINLNKN